MNVYQFLAFLIAILMVIPTVFMIVCLLTINSITTPREDIFLYGRGDDVLKNIA